jgi:hypothetical protein
MKVMVGALGGVVAGAGLAAALSGSMAAGLLDFWFSDEKIYRVQLDPKGSSGKLKVKLKKGKECKGEFDGCMRFPEDRVGLINFYIKDKGPKKEDRQCPGAEYVITEIKLSTTPKGGDADGNKGDFTVAPAPWLKTDAFPGVETNGVIYTANATTGRSRVWLTNDNSNKADDGTKTFWYQVTVTKCSDGTTLTTDPRGDNTGLK